MTCSAWEKKGVIGHGGTLSVSEVREDLRQTRHVLRRADEEDVGEGLAAGPARLASIQPSRTMRTKWREAADAGRRAESVSFRDGALGTRAADASGPL